MLAHEVSAQSTVKSLDLTKVLFYQIGTRSMILRVPYGPCIIGPLVVVGVFNLLLELERLDDLKIDKAGVEFLPTAPLVLESKAHTHNYLLRPKRNIDSGVPGSSLYSARLADRSHKLIYTLLVQMAEGMRGIITLLVHDGINNVIGQAQGKKHPRDRSPVRLSIYGLALAISGGAKVPCGSSHLAGPTFHMMFISGPFTGTITSLAYLAMHFLITWGGHFFVCHPILPLIDILIAWSCQGLGLGRWLCWFFSLQLSG